MKTLTQMLVEEQDFCTSDEIDLISLNKVVFYSLGGSSFSGKPPSSFGSAPTPLSSFGSAGRDHTEVKEFGISKFLEPSLPSGFSPIGPLADAGQYSYLGYNFSSLPKPPSSFGSAPTPPSSFGNGGSYNLYLSATESSYKIFDSEKGGAPLIRLDLNPHHGMPSKHLQFGEDFYTDRKGEEAVEIFSQILILNHKIRFPGEK